MIEEIDDLCIKQDRYGFTIPYLYKIEKNNNREKSINEILKFLSEQTKSYIITYCDDLEEFVIGLHKREYAPLHMYQSYGQLHYDQDKIIGMNSFEDLVSFMENRYQARIDQETFSKNPDTKNWE
ncbi:MAG: hypothetical protein HQ521_04220 [Bacteroidetes bacterium]|nr:hypothetical protein [Bacteroidota bacterium]